MYLLIPTVAVLYIIMQTVYVFNVNNTLLLLEITWAPVASDVAYFYVQKVSVIATNATTYVASINGDRALRSQIYGELKIQITSSMHMDVKTSSHYSQLAVSVFNFCILLMSRLYALTLKFLYIRSAKFY